VIEAAARHPGLRIELHALATRVLLDEGRRAVGIEYLSGERLYRADPHPNLTPGVPRQIIARREVIVAGGAFNTPQLLMLSGIGPAAHLAEHGIPVRVDLRGVGSNLQDRYEIGVVNRMTHPWESLAGARFERGDPLYREWQERQTGMYVSNGGAIAVARRSEAGKADPDLFLMALLARFYGYFPGYSHQIVEHHDYLSWAILKAHTANRAGTVRLRSEDPRDTPLVEFNYFDADDDPGGEDMRAVVAGIRLAREMVDALNKFKAAATEELPGRQYQSDEELTSYVRDNAWGHHASCSCAIGTRESGGVLGADFKVHGTSGLRVVDASVFPRIPGFFVASAVYMVAEKAAETILADAKRGVGPTRASPLSRPEPR
jgi:choline dehydrogenase-like flavoprotein